MSTPRSSSFLDEASTGALAMNRPRLLAFAFFVALALSACGDALVAPTPPAANGSLLSLLSPKTAKVVNRTTPLARDEVVSKVVGSAGGVLELPSAGLTVTVPSGALKEPVRITVTAPAGSLVGYHFEPHGLQFAKPLVASQKIAGTQIGVLRALLSPPYAAYFEDELAPRVKVLEILDLNVLDLLGVARFRIQHFSGYVIATD
jgi:hypothetical protein